MAVVHPLRELDIPAVFARLHPQAGTAYVGSRDRLAEIVAAVLEEDGAAVVTLAPDATVIGFAALESTCDGAELVALWVHRDFRRRGLARAMLSAFTPVWSAGPVCAIVPEQAALKPVEGLLAQFGFRPLRPRVYRVRQVRRTPGRASLVRVRS